MFIILERCVIKNSIDCISQIAALNDKLARCKQVIEGLPGTELTRTQQEQLYQKYEQKLKRKWYSFLLSMI